jgi:hypothetical protein
MLACCSFFIINQAHAFTANSLDITIDKNGDALASFHFTLEGIIENSIPQSILEEELKKGLTTSSNPPVLQSMDRSSAVLVMKNFADTSDVPTGTNYLTASMDFRKAQIALQNSELSSVVSADFSPKKVTITFPDSYTREFSNVDSLPAVAHVVIDPSKTPLSTATPGIAALPDAPSTPGTAAPSAATGSMNVTSTPTGVKVFLDSGYIGEAPAVFTGITSGTHTVGFSEDDFESISKNVTIIAGKTTNVLVVLRYIPPATTPDDTSSSPGIAWLGVLIVLIAIAGGGYYLWSEKKKKDDEAEDDTTECESE